MYQYNQLVISSKWANMSARRNSFFIFCIQILLFYCLIKVISVYAMAACLFIISNEEL